MFFCCLIRHPPETAVSNTTTLIPCQKQGARCAYPTTEQKAKKPCLYHHKVQQEKNQQPKTRKPAPTPTPDLKDGRPKRVRKSDTSRQEVVTNGQLGW